MKEYLDRSYQISKNYNLYHQQIKMLIFFEQNLKKQQRVLIDIFCIFCAFYNRELF